MNSKDIKKEVDKTSAVFYGSSGPEQGNSRLSHVPAHVVTGGEVVAGVTPDSYKTKID